MPLSWISFDTGTSWHSRLINSGRKLDTTASPNKTVTNGSDECWRNYLDLSLMVVPKTPDLEENLGPTDDNLSLPWGGNVAYPPFFRLEPTPLRPFMRYFQTRRKRKSICRLDTCCQYRVFRQGAWGIFLFSITRYLLKMSVVLAVPSRYQVIVCKM